MMESIEKLREWVKSLYTPNSGELKVEGLDIADEIEAEITERYMLLPCDADGVPIHVGDLLYLKNGDMHFCHGIGKPSLDVMDEHCEWWRSGGFTHVNPRTIEDVLRDLVDGIGDVEFDALTAIGDAADEIRELMEVDA